MVELHGTSMILLFDEQMQGKSRTLRAASVTIGSKIGPSKLEQLRLLFIYQEKNFKITNNIYCVYEEDTLVWRTR